MRDEASYFREQAERCEKLAREAEDPTIKERLLNLASEYSRRADVRPPPPVRRRRAPTYPNRG